MNQKGFEQVSSTYQKGVLIQAVCRAPHAGIQHNLSQTRKERETLNKEIIAFEKKRKEIIYKKQNKQKKQQIKISIIAWSLFFCLINHAAMKAS